MRIIILTLLFFLSRQTFSQDAGFVKVDNYVETLKVDRNISVDNLVLALVKPFTSPTLKTRAIYYWIAKNIRYDYQGSETDFWDKYPSKQAILTDTYKFRKGICSGYAHLFKYMNSALAQIGINFPKHRKRAIDIGESLGIYRDYPVSKGCTSPFAPVWINEMVRRKAG